MSLNTHKVTISYSLTTRRSDQASSAADNTSATLALSSVALDGKIVQYQYPVASTGTVSILPPSIAAGWEMVIIPEYDSAEPIATQLFTVTRTVSATDHIIKGVTMLAVALVGTESAIVLQNNGTQTNSFRVVYFKRTA